MYFFFSYGISLKFYRRSLECQLCVTNMHVYNKLGHILEHCGNCYLAILKFWDKIEQYTSELETDEFYDVELRETLISNSEDCTNKGYQILFAISNYLHYIILNFFMLQI